YCLSEMQRQWKLFRRGSARHVAVSQSHVARRRLSGLPKRQTPVQRTRSHPLGSGGFELARPLADQDQLRRIALPCAAAMRAVAVRHAFQRFSDIILLTVSIRQSAVARHGEGRLNVRHWVKFGYGFLVLAAVVVRIDVAHAQNLDQGKPAAKLFADSCAACHHNARGLAKGRFNLVLFLFLQQHYTSNSSSAWTLTSYLESLDVPQRNAPTKSARRSSTTSARPPAPMSGR